MDVVELLGKVSRQASVTIAIEADARAASEYAFVGGHPLDAEAVGDRNRFLGDAAFRRPHSFGTGTENLFVQIKPAQNLLARIFGMPKAVLRKRQSGRRHGTSIGIADERKNGMVEGRGGKFYRTFLSGRRMGW